MRRKAVIDSSFWINTHRAGLTPWLLDLFQIYFPPEVSDELEDSFPSGQEFWRLVRKASLLEVKAVHEEVIRYGRGERAAINVALERRDLLLLIDDRKPRNYATELGLEVFSSAELVVECFDNDLMNLDETVRHLARLSSLGTLSPEIVAQSLRDLSVAVDRKEQEHGRE